MKLPKWQTFFPVLIVLLLCLLPIFMHSPRYLSLFDQLFLNLVLAIGVYSLWSVGLINAAQPVFFGLGAYTVAILIIRVHFALLANISDRRNRSSCDCSNIWFLGTEDERLLFLIFDHSIM